MLLSLSQQIFEMSKLYWSIEALDNSNFKRIEESLSKAGLNCLNNVYSLMDISKNYCQV